MTSAWLRTHGRGIEPPVGPGVCRAAVNKLRPLQTPVSLEATSPVSCPGVCTRM